MTDPTLTHNGDILPSLPLPPNLLGHKGSYTMGHVVVFYDHYVAPVTYSDLYKSGSSTALETYHLTIKAGLSVYVSVTSLSGLLDTV